MCCVVFVPLHLHLTRQGLVFWPINKALAFDNNRSFSLMQMEQDKHYKGRDRENYYILCPNLSPVFLDDYSDEPIHCNKSTPTHWNIIALQHCWYVPYMQFAQNKNE